MDVKKLTCADLRSMKKAGEKISMLTAYDAGFARMLDETGIDVLLVGDSLGMVLLGYESTVPVTMDEMILHAAAVKRGCRRALLVADMPFLSYQADPREAIRNAGRFLKEAGCDAVKMEGGSEIAATVRAVVQAGIPVMGHIGLTPQTAGQLGGFKVQGRDLESARRLVRSARDLVEAGAFAIVLECIPDRLAQVITEQMTIPAIGIGAGPACDGQVLVTHDLLGIFERFRPRFVKAYANLAPVIKEAVASFAEEVKKGRFPGPEQSFSIKLEEEEFLRELGLQED